MAHPIITLANLIRKAQQHTPGGVLFAADLTGLYRRTASLHGLTAAEIAHMHRHTEAAGGVIRGAKAA